METNTAVQWHLVLFCTILRWQTVVMCSDCGWKQQFLPVFVQLFIFINDLIIHFRQSSVSWNMKIIGDRTNIKKYPKTTIWIGVVTPLASGSCKQTITKILCQNNRDIFVVEKPVYWTIGWRPSCLVGANSLC